MDFGQIEWHRGFYSSQAIISLRLFYFTNKMPQSGPGPDNENGNGFSGKKKNRCEEDSYETDKKDIGNIGDCTADYSLGRMYNRSADNGRHE